MRPRARDLEHLSRRTTIALALAVLSSCLATAAASAGDSCAGLLYVANSYSDDVTVVDTKTNEVVTAIPVGAAPYNVVFTPDGRHVYVSNNQEGTISVIDVATQTVVDTIPGGGPRPAGLAFTPDGKRLVVSLMGDPIFSPGSVRVITLATGEMTSPVPVGFDPEQIRITPDGKRVYVANLLSDAVSVVDLDQNAVVATIPFQGPPGGRAGPFNLLISQNGHEVYVGVVFQNYVAVIDTRSNAVVDTITTGFGPNGLAFGRDRRSLYVTNFFSSTIGEYDLATGEELRVDSTVVGDPAFVKLTADGKHAYFGSAYGTEMSVFDTRAFTTVDTITTGVGSNALDICRSP